MRDRPATVNCTCQNKDSKVKVLLLRRYVLSKLSQLATRASSRGVIQRELQLANVYIIGLLDADSLTCKLISLTRQFDSYVMSLRKYISRETR